MQVNQLIQFNGKTVQLKKRHNPKQGQGEYYLIDPKKKPAYLSSLYPTDNPQEYIFEVSGRYWILTSSGNIHSSTLSVWRSTKRRNQPRTSTDGIFPPSPPLSLPDGLKGGFCGF
jgi:hypothetical protein